jgi:hypothetical protein
MGPIFVVGEGREDGVTTFITTTYNGGGNGGRSTNHELIATTHHQLNTHLAHSTYTTFGLGKQGCRL